MKTADDIKYSRLVRGLKQAVDTLQAARRETPSWHQSCEIAHLEEVAKYRDYKLRSFIRHYMAKKLHNNT